MKKIIISSAAFLFGVVLAGCGADQTPAAPSEQSPSEAVAESSGACPSGWVDTRFVQILCAPGHEYQEADFGGVTCARCAPTGGEEPPTQTVTPTVVTPSKEFPVARVPVTKEPVQSQPPQEPVKEEPTKTEPVQQAPVVQEPVVQEPPKQEPVSQEPPKEGAVVQEPPKQAPVQQEPVSQEPVTQDPGTGGGGGGSGGDCQSNSDCFVSGCSGQVCANENVFTTCEFRPEYACYHQAYAHCVCTSGRCGWEDNAQLRECLASGGPDGN